MNDSSIKTGCIITAVISIGVACYASVKSSMAIDKYEKLIDKAADDIAMKPEDVSESIKQKAVEIAVAKTAKIVARDVSDKIENALEKEAKNQVASVVKTQADNVKKEVKQQIQKQVDDVDIDDLKEEIVSKAAYAAEERFSNELDGIIQKQTDKLEEITKVYSSISEMMSGYITNN